MKYTVVEFFGNEWWVSSLGYDACLLVRNKTCGLIDSGEDDVVVLTEDSLRLIQARDSRNRHCTLMDLVRHTAESQFCGTKLLYQLP